MVFASLVKLCESAADAANPIVGAVPSLLITAARLRADPLIAVPIRAGTAVLSAAALLSIPTRGVTIPSVGTLVDPPALKGGVASSSAMMSSALCGMLAIKGAHVAFGGLARAAEEKAVADGDAQAAPAPDRARPVWRDYADLARDCLWYMLPVKVLDGEIMPMDMVREADRDPQQRSHPNSRRAHGTASYLGIAVRSAMMAGVAAAKARGLTWVVPRAYWAVVAGGAPIAGYVDLMKRTAWILPIVSLSTFALDYLAAAVTLLSVGKVTLLDSYKFVPMSASPGEFWGSRYNLLVNSLLREAIYDPVRRLCGARYGSAPAVMATFAVSGLLHEYVVHITFDGLWRGSSMAFFLMHGVAVCVDGWTAKHRPAAHAVYFQGVTGWILWHSFLIATAPFYLGIFTSFGEEYLTKNFGHYLPTA